MHSRRLEKGKVEKPNIDNISLDKERKPRHIVLDPRKERLTNLT